MAQNYQLTIRAEGEVRDKDGNLISSEPLEGQTVLTEEQAQQLLAELVRRQSQQSQPAIGDEKE